VISFSVIIPTYNRAAKLRACLEALACQDFPREDYEVIVVDDGGSQSLEAMVDGFCGRMQCVLLRQSNSGPAAARNHGSREARGAFLAFTDDDCVPDAGWLTALNAAHGRDPQALLGGATCNALVTDPFAMTNQLLSDAVTSWWRLRDSPLSFFPSNNISAPAQLYRDVGGFTTAIRIAGAEDRHFSQKWSMRGWPLIFVPNARIRHFHGQNLRRFVAMHFRYGRGAHLFHLNRADGGHGRFPLEGLSFYANMLLCPFRRHQIGRAIQFSALIALSQAALAGGYLYERAAGEGKACAPETADV
jgi:GT2 family glycosyltransferase